ncbi:hypothetical protein SteCoe_6998 [Stentor coeruleus]|uniref:Uncharacterized protein n=1 Tax=Stentor coeruleus TaxID=5963 RepID=A0A1R2CNR5_9CILI|nr:hypothetical protein SteCoe_6998 [Stentor coeruleus]
MDSEVFLSGCSLSTHTSAIPTGKVLQLDNETLEAQIDRLNYTLMGILKNDEKEFCDSFSFQACDEFITTEDDFLDKHENTDLLLERAMMTHEDYRSHETRNDVTAKKDLKVSVKLDELHQIRNVISKTLELVEKKITNVAKIKIGEIMLELDIIDSVILAAKNEVVSGFKNNNFESDTQNAYIKQLENELENLNYKVFHNSGDDLLEKAMYESYNDSFPLVYPTSKYSGVFDFHSNFHTQASIEIEYKTMRVLNNSRKDYVKELEWEITQAKLVKINYEEKSKSLDEKEKKISKYVNSIHEEIQKKLKALEIEKSKVRVEQEKAERIITYMRRFREQVKRIKDGFVIQENLNVTISTLTPIATPKHTPKPSIDEMTIIEQEITQLELELEEATDKNSLIFKMNHLRNRLSSLRSAKVLNSETNIKRFNTFARVSRQDDAVIPKSLNSSKLDLSINLQNLPVPYTPKIGTRRFTCFTKRVHDHSPEICYQETTRTNLVQSPIQEFAKEENLVKALELKEERLRKKEEELNKREITLQNTWMKVPNANELIPLVRAQMSYYENKCKSMEKTQGDIDILIKENLNNKKAIKSAQENVKKYINELEAKKVIAEKLEDLIKDAEEFII